MKGLACARRRKVNNDYALLEVVDLSTFIAVVKGEINITKSDKRSKRLTRLQNLARRTRRILQLVPRPPAFSPRTDDGMDD